jgi:hypothetical protein
MATATSRESFESEKYGKVGQFPSEINTVCMSSAVGFDKRDIATFHGDLLVLSRRISSVVATTCLHMPFDYRFLSPAGRRPRIAKACEDTEGVVLLTSGCIVDCQEAGHDRSG